MTTRTEPNTAAITDRFQVEVARVGRGPVATLIIAVSLAWSIVSHVLQRWSRRSSSGAMVGPGTLITAPLSRSPIRPDPQVVNKPVLTVRPRNTGRLSLSVYEELPGTISLSGGKSPTTKPAAVRTSRLDIVFGLT